MKNKVLFSLFACMLFSIFYSCQESPGSPTNTDCVIGITFEVISSPCENPNATFELVFLDDSGNWSSFPFVLPDDANTINLINLPSGSSYGAWVRGTGGYKCDDDGPLYFKINVLDPATGDLCVDIITSVDGRPDVIDESNPLITFDLKDICDGCPEINDPVDECVPSLCGGSFNGSYDLTGYYEYPIEELYLCPEECVRVIGDPTGIPNRYTLRANGNVINSQWVGDGLTYPQGPWNGTVIPFTYNYTFFVQPDTEYTLQVATVNPSGMTDVWSATLTCMDCQQ